MNASIQQSRIGNPFRWRAWAQAIAAARPLGRLGVIRSRRQLQMALRRRTRILSWIAPRNILSVNSVQGSSVFSATRLQLAIDWSSPLTRIFQTTAGPSFAVDGASGGREGQAAAGVGSRYLRSFQTDHSHSRSLLRELAERTRRIEERVRVEKRVLGRGQHSNSISPEVRELRRRSGPDWWKSEVSAPAPQPVAVPTVNVDQIAETVMRQIDHRVSAWRDRTGRS